MDKRGNTFRRGIRPRERAQSLVNHPRDGRVPVTPNHRADIAHTRAHAHARTQECAGDYCRRSHSCEPYWGCSRQLPSRCLQHTNCECTEVRGRSEDIPSRCINEPIYSRRNGEDYSHYNNHRKNTNIPFSRDTIRDSESRVSQEVLRNKYRYSNRGHLDDDHFDIQLT